VVPEVLLQWRMARICLSAWPVAGRRTPTTGSSEHFPAESVGMITDGAHRLTEAISLLATNPSSLVVSFYQSASCCCFAVPSRDTRCVPILAASRRYSS
jgi:hypothetical protein